MVDVKTITKMLEKGTSSDKSVQKLIDSINKGTFIATLVIKKKEQDGVVFTIKGAHKLEYIKKSHFKISNKMINGKYEVSIWELSNFSKE